MKKCFTWLPFILGFVPAALVPLAAPVHAETKEFAAKGVSITFDVLLPVSPDTAFAAATGDVLPWWDHHFAAAPTALYIEPKPGGDFMEIFDIAGNGVRHAEVTLAERGKRLRFEGALGLAGAALTLVTTWEFLPDSAGTRLRLTCNAAGQMEDNTGESLERVWRHFLEEQLKTYIESGRYREKWTK